MKTLGPLLLVASLGLILTGCGSTSRAKTATGTVLGAAGGALVGSLTGHAGTGAAIGASVGTVGGVLVDEYQQGSFDRPADAP